MSIHSKISISLESETRRTAAINADENARALLEQGGMTIITNYVEEARRTTADDIREMEDLLPSILRKHGAVDAKDGDSIDILDGEHFMGLADEKRRNVNRDYVNKLKRRYDVLSTIPVSNELNGCSLPLHLIAHEADDKSDRQWKDVEFLLSKLPPHMAKQAIRWKDGYFGFCPLHVAAERSTIMKMLELAPEAARIQNIRDWLPLHRAVHYSSNAVAVEFLTKIYPQSLFMNDDLGRDPIYFAFVKKSEKFPIVSAIIRGLMFGLCNDVLFPQFEKITTIMTELIIEKYDSNDGDAFTPKILKCFVESYENRDDCDMYEMLLTFYCMLSKEPDILDLKPYFEIVFGNFVGVHTMSMAVEYRLLNIIERERDEETKHNRCRLLKL